MAALLAVGTTAATSADFTLTGESTSLFLVATAGLESGSAASVDVKGANGVYYPIGALTLMAPFLVLSSPGTFRVSRGAGVSVGVDRV